VQPEVFARANHFHILVQVGGFFDVAVRVEFVHPADIPLCFGSGKNYNWNSPKIFILLNFMQHLPAVFFWEIQIEKDQIGLRGVDKRGESPEICESFLAIFHSIEFLAGASIPQGFTHQPYVPRIILHQKNVEWSGMPLEQIYPPLEVLKKINSTNTALGAKLEASSIRLPLV
jgi:hypothetical protein